MDHRILENFESQCAQDTPPACQCRCPVQVEAGTVATLTASGQVNEARRVLERHLPLAPLTAYLCEGPCREKCLRRDLDSAVNLPLLEIHLVKAGKAVKAFPLPGTGKRLAIIGADLAALVCAFELAKKGHQPVIHHLGEPGGTLIAETRLPEGALSRALDDLRRLKARFARFESAEELSRLASDFASQGFSGAFVDLGDPASAQGLAALVGSDPDPVTMASALDSVFMFGGADFQARIAAMSSGKKAAASLDRLIQGVDPATAREKERISDSRLVVSLKGREIVPEAACANPLSPAPSEAASEAARCLACACLACLPPCPFLRERPGHPKKFAREFYNNIITAFGNRSSNRFINSCAECGLCGQICPTGADLGRFVDLCRQFMVATSHMPVSTFEQPLEDQVFSNGPEAAFWRHQPGLEESRFMLFPGCQLIASEPGRTLALYKHLAENLSGGVGLWSGCCGAPGRWSGRMGLTGTTMDCLKKAWREAGEPRVLLACPSCALMLKREAPEMRTESLWPLLADLPLPAGAKAPPGPLLIHDPCSARLDVESQDAVRRLFSRLGREALEPEWTRRLTLCCGYGGLVDQAYPDLGGKFALQRTKEAEGKTIAAWCVMCRDRFRTAGARAVHPLNLLFPDGLLFPDDLLFPDAFAPKRDPAANPAAAALLKPPGLSKRRENRGQLKRLALKELWGETPPEAPSMNLKIDIPADVLERLEARRILASDVESVLEAAAADGPTFVNSKTGRSLRSHRPRQVTFWVEYERREDGSFLVHRAWCHRMSIPEVTGEGAESPASLEGYARDGGRV